MAYLDYYRSAPNWATNQWQSIAPPAPTFQPQPSWGGPDFYRATAGGNYDGGVYDYAQNRLHGLGTQGLASAGPTLVEAKLMHRRAYGGLGDVLTMLPMEIGTAAAYEVWRNWRYNYGTLAQPLSGDAMRQREALVGLAISEATKLWQYTTRVGDNAGRLAAIEAAAIAAARIFDQGNNSLMRSGGAYGSVGSGMGMGMGASMGAISPALSAGTLSGGALGAGGSGMGMGMGMGMGIDPTGAGFSAPPLFRQRSLSTSAAPAGFGYGSGMEGLSGVNGVSGYAGTANTGAGMGGAGMYGGANGMLGTEAGMGIQRPLSAGGFATSSGTGYGPGELGESAIMRHERHRAERAEHAALRASRYGNSNYGRGRAYDDNYEYEYGHGGHGGDYGDRYSFGGGSSRPSFGRYGRRPHRAERALEQFSSAAGRMGMGGHGGGRYGGYAGEPF